MSLVIDATAQSPARCANSSASVLRKGRRTRRSVSSLDIRHARAAGPPCKMMHGIGQLSHIPPAQGLGAEVIAALCGIVHRPGDGFYRTIRGLLRSCLGPDRDVDPPVALGGELDVAFREREQRVISSHADIGAGMPLRPS